MPQLQPGRRADTITSSQFVSWAYEEVCECLFVSWAYEEVCERESWWGIPE